MEKEIIIKSKSEAMDFGRIDKEMNFLEWQEYLTKLACAVYKITPEQIGGLISIEKTKYEALKD